MGKKVSKGIKLRNAMKRGKYPAEVVGYFLQSDREFVRDETGRMWNLYDKYIRGKAFAKKVHVFDGNSDNGWLIDFTEYKPKTKKLTAYKTMQSILKKAATAGVISKSMASSFKLGKIIAPVVDGKIELGGLDYEDKIKVKPAKKSRKKPLTIAKLAKEIHAFLEGKGYVAASELGKIRVWKNKNKRIRKQSRAFLLNGAQWWAEIQRRSKGRYSIGFQHEIDDKQVNEYFHGMGMVFDDTDKKVLLGMLKRMGIKPSRITKK